MRISSACDLVQRGVYKTKVEEDTPETGFEELEKEEEVKREKLSFYMNLENWLHFSPEICKNGRVTLEEFEFAEDMEEEAKDALRKELVDIIAPALRLKPITKDKSKLMSRNLGSMLAF